MLKIYSLNNFSLNNLTKYEKKYSKFISFDFPRSPAFLAGFPQVGRGFLLHEAQKFQHSSHD